jgi:hypothetical protein
MHKLYSPCLFNAQFSLYHAVPNQPSAITSPTAHQKNQNLSKLNPIKQTEPARRTTKPQAAHSNIRQQYLPSTPNANAPQSSNLLSKTLKHCKQKHNTTQSAATSTLQTKHNAKAHIRPNSWQLRKHTTRKFTQAVATANKHTTM